MSKIKNGGLDSMALNALNSSNLEQQLALKGLILLLNSNCCNVSVVDSFTRFMIFCV